MAKLIYTYGAMNSAKSATLIMQAYQHKQNGKKVLIYKPALDTRNEMVFSRAVPTSMRADCVVAPEEESLLYLTAFKERPRIVLVDEVQFFTPAQIDVLAEIVDGLGITVQAYGLLTDFRGELFAGSERLIRVADVVERVRSECTICDGEGLFNARFINGEITLHGEQIVTGAEETYKVLCRSCFNNMCEPFN